MQFKKLVRPEHLNHHGVLFGGYLLQWVDEFAYLAALEDYPNVHFVTRAMDASSFKQSVHNGAIITFDITRSRVGTTSVTYEVNVTGRRVTSTEILHVFSTHVTMCAIDSNGQKTPLPPLASQASSSCPSTPSSSSCPSTQSSPSSRSCLSSQVSKESQA